MIRKELAIVLASNPKRGGGFQYSRSILEALTLNANSHTRITALCLDPQWLPLASQLCHRAIVVKPHPFVWKKIRGFLRRIPYGAPLWEQLRPLGSPLWRALQDIKPNLVFSPCDAQLVMDSPVPTVVPIHDLMYLYEPQFPEVGSPAIHRGRLLDDRLICRSAHAILVDSGLGAQHVRDSFGVAPARLHVLPYVALRNADAGLEPPGEEWRSGIPSRYFIYPAQFWMHKNHLGLLRAMKLLSDGGLKVNAVFCGSEKNSGKQIASCIAELGLQDQVKCLGFVSDAELAWLYRNSVGMVMPSYFGPTNIPALEAMQLGCPVAVSRIYAMEEQLGDAALYFDPNRPEEIAGAMQRLWTNPAARETLIVKGQRHAAAWTLKEFAVRLGDIIDKCLQMPQAVDQRRLD
jgi:glycosyltransferase involved in cell wall biosynthesis